MADIKKLVEETIEKIKGDPKLLESFKSDPVKTIEGMTGIDIPDEAVSGVVAGVKAKLAAGDLKDTAGDIKDAIGGLFGKK